MSDDLVKRSMEGETYAGLEVMAYMEDCDTPMGIIPRYSSHWSTPGAGAKNVQRLFSQSQVDGLLAQLAQRDAALKAADELARVSQTLLDEYGFASNGSDNYREVRVCDIAGLDNARAIYRKARGQDA